MLVITTSTGNFLRYEVSGTLSRKDLRCYYQQLDQQYATAGQLRLLVVITGFRGYTSLRALRTVLLNEHKVLLKTSQYAAVTNQPWFARLIRVLNFMVPMVKMRTFLEEDEAVVWLEQCAD